MAELKPVLSLVEVRSGSPEKPPGFQLPVGLTRLGLGLGGELAWTNPGVARPETLAVPQRLPPTQTPS